ncbi:MAG TPA: flavin reductase family protein [Thermoanaerobaculia bacterium]|nr:flavin reductase family protein [Thermoanaerobaculia bacterium]
MTVDPHQFRNTLAQFASGVTVVTVSHEGVRTGLTVSAFCSLSLQPPLVLICIENSIRSHTVIDAAGHFAVNVLSEEQQEISNRFASSAEDKFSGLATREGTMGDPLIEGSLATIQCRIVDRYSGGDHTIFVGEVIESEIAEQQNPLLYFRGGYRSLG